MKYRFSVLVAVLLVSMTIASGRTATDFFKLLPPEDLPLLPLSTRLDMIDYYNYGLPTASNNILGGKARITKILPHLVEFETSANSTGSVSVFQLGKDTIVAYVETITSPIPDSHISIYRPDTAGLSGKTEVPLPDPELFLPKKIRSSAKAALAEVPLFFVSVEGREKPGVFVLRNNTRGYFIPEETPEILTLTADSLLMTIDKTGRWKPLH